MWLTPKEFILFPLLCLKYWYYTSLNMSLNMSLIMSLNLLVEKNNLDFKHFTKSLSYRTIAIWLIKYKRCCIGFNNVLRVTMSLNKSLIMSLSKLLTMSLSMSLSKSLTTSMTCIRMNMATAPSQFSIPSWLLVSQIATCNFTINQVTKHNNHRSSSKITTQSQEPKTRPLDT
jgi:hypothetical protein